MNVLLVSSEATPFAQSGGLADVVSSLSKELNKKINTRVLIPYYKSIKEDFSLAFKSEITFLNKIVKIEIYHLSYEGAEYYALSHPYFTKREGLYGPSSFSPYSDNFFRYYLFTLVAVNFEKITNWKIDIIHANDWQSALSALLVKKLNLNYKTIFTIHNLGYQGVFNKFNSVILDHIDTSVFDDAKNINMMRSAIIHSDLVTTVSPNYAKEIQGEEFGAGLNTLLAENSNKIVGILNGIDTNIWNPEKDKFINHHYSIKTLENKTLNKNDFQLECFDDIKDVPLFGIVSRLAEQKGIEPLIKALKRALVDFDIRVVVVGTGKEEYERELLDMQNEHKNLKTFIAFNNRLSHMVEASSDFFFMPSVYEPCGLNQMYSLRYGTLVIASNVGGLKDTVTDCKNGIIIKSVDEDEIYKAIRKAIEIYNDKVLLRSMRENAMSLDFSWQGKSQAYLKEYKRILKEKKI